MQAGYQYDNAPDYRARYYDPQVGRFISEDPIGVGGGINFYVYVGNSPTGYVDPSGLVCYTPEKRRVFNWLNGPLGQMAKDLNTTKALMLTMAAKEGGWDTKGLNRNQPLNNPFGINRIKNGKAVGNVHYPSLLNAIQSWENMFGDRVRDIKKPDDFVYELQHPGGGKKPYTSHKDTYEDDYQDIYDLMLQYMEACGIQR